MGRRDRVMGRVRVWLDIIAPPIRPKLHSLLLTGALDVSSTYYYTPILLGM